MYLEADIEYLGDVLGGRDQVKLRDAFGGCDRASLVMHLEAKIVGLTDALGDHDRATLEIHLEARIHRDWRISWRWSIWRR